MNVGNRLFKKKDWLLIAGILAAAVFLYAAGRPAFGEKGAVAVIYYESEPVETVKLNQGIEERFCIPQNSHVIFHLFPDGSICFEESDCPDQICVRSGRLQSAGESAACLPNRIVLKILPAGNSSGEEVDLTTG